MDRRKFLNCSALLGGAFLLDCSGSDIPIPSKPDKPQKDTTEGHTSPGELSADIVIIGGGMGGCAAALAACRNGKKVVMTEETKWIGGQVTAQGVPLDEHQWIEKTGAPASYRKYRNNIRAYYRDNYPLLPQYRTDAQLNPGKDGGYRLGHEPRVSLAVINAMLQPYVTSKRLKIYLNTKAVKAEVTGDKVDAVTVVNTLTGDTTVLLAKYFVDATELGDLLPMTGTEYVTGAEAQSETNEMHAAKVANPANNQAWTYCLAIEYLDGEDHTIEKPAEYDFWKDYVPALTPPWAPGKLFSEDYSTPSDPAVNKKGFVNPLTTAGESGFNWWTYRKILSKDIFPKGTYKSDITILNWPQNDYLGGNIVDVDEAEFKAQVEHSKQLSLSFLYWLQTECPRRDGKQGWPGMHLRKDVFDSEDGLALYPYIREARRIKAMTTILEEHVGKENRAIVSGDDKAYKFWDSVGLGYYHLDLHPTCTGDNYIDTPSLNFQIPLGALIPVRMTNLIPACKNIGTTHITNGCYRLHPVEWSIGEAVGCMLAYVLDHDYTPKSLWEDRGKVAAFQGFITGQGIDTEWKI